MDALDSRSLRYTDCFIHKFTKPDKISYSIMSPVNKVLPMEEELPFTIRVKASQAKPGGEQHNVTVKYDGRNFSANPAELEITSEDFVLWNAPDASTPGFVVMGEGKKTKFDSSALTAGAVYTHAFGLPGEYSWVDPNYDSARGRVRVVSTAATDKGDKYGQQQRLLEILKKPVVILIKENETQPADVQVMVGQTVFWAVEQSSGIAITDARLVVEPTYGARGSTETAS